MATVDAALVYEMQVFARSNPLYLWGQKVITRSSMGSLIQHKHLFFSRTTERIKQKFALVKWCIIR